MMQWLIKQKNILDEPADILICSANVCLNLSGGVGAELLDRYGPTMQSKLHHFIENRNPRCAEKGEYFVIQEESMPYKAIIHAVASNGFYESSPQIVTDLVQKSLEAAASLKAKSVSLTALATGYGDLSLSQFSNGLKPLLGKEFNPIEKVVICLIDEDRVQELNNALFG